MISHARGAGGRTVESPILSPDAAMSQNVAN